MVFLYYDKILWWKLGRKYYVRIFFKCILKVRFVLKFFYLGFDLKIRLMYDFFFLNRIKCK